jgi:hypothetical protein
MVSKVAGVAAVAARTDVPQGRMFVPFQTEIQFVDADFYGIDPG